MAGQASQPPVVPPAFSGLSERANWQISRSMVHFGVWGKQDPHKISMAFSVLICWLGVSLITFYALLKMMERASDARLYRHANEDPENQKLQLKAAARASIRAAQRLRRGAAKESVQAYANSLAYFGRADLGSMWRGGAGLGYAATLQGLAVAQRHAGDLEASETTFSQFVERAEFENFDPAVVAAGFRQLGEIQVERGDLDRGCQSLREAAERFSAAGPGAILEADRIRERLAQVLGPARVEARS